MSPRFHHESLYSFVFSVDPPFGGTQCKLASPHTNAIIDLDGDCLAGQFYPADTVPYLCLTFQDIFLVCDEGSGRRSFEIWVNNKDSGFSRAQYQMLPSGVQAITFADVGKSSGIDLECAPMYTLQIEMGLSTWCSQLAHRCRQRLASALVARLTLPTTSRYQSAPPLGPRRQISKGTNSADRPKSFASRIQTSSLT